MGTFTGCVVSERTGGGRGGAWARDDFEFLRRNSHISFRSGLLHFSLDLHGFYDRLSVRNKEEKRERERRTCTRHLIKSSLRRRLVGGVLSRYCPDTEVGLSVRVRNDSRQVVDNFLVCYRSLRIRREVILFPIDLNFDLINTSKLEERGEGMNSLL
jgi:hypothetical protein